MANTSPPSRAAWIEIKNEQINAQTVQSPPSRAAWIEMGMRSQEKRSQ